MPITITMPALSPTMTEGTLAKWLLKEGDKVHAGDMLAEIETDKATMEVEAIDDGVLARILVAEGTEGVAVNTPIAIILEDGEDAADVDAAADAAASAPAAAPTKEEPAPAETAAPAPEPEPAAASEPAPAPAAPRAKGERILASPLARRMAEQAGLDLAALKGSGPRGRIVKADIEAAIAGGAPAAAPAPAPADEVAPAAAPAPSDGEFELEPLNTMRKTVARRMAASKREVPHFYLTMDCEIDALLALRKDLNERADGAFKLSVNDLVIKAAAVALMKVPDANVAYSEEGIRRYKQADISVAVASERGLITPIIRNANGKGLEAISKEMRELAQKANDGKLMPEEYQGGSFSISNLGMFGVKHFDAVINTPQACILAVGAGEQRPVVKDGALAVATVMTVTLSVDHRAVDGALGARYLAAFKGLVEDPMTMLL